MPKNNLLLFLLNISKEALSDFLNESGILNKPTNLTKSKMVELIINNGVLTAGNAFNILSNNAERLTITNTKLQKRLLHMMILFVHTMLCNLSGSNFNNKIEFDDESDYEYGYEYNNKTQC